MKKDGMLDNAVYAIGRSERWPKALKRVRLFFLNWSLVNLRTGWNVLVHGEIRKQAEKDATLADDLNTTAMRAYAALSKQDQIDVQKRLIKMRYPQMSQAQQDMLARKTARRDRQQAKEVLRDRQLN